MKKYIIIIALFVLLPACSQQALIDSTSGAIGCAPSEIKILSESDPIETVQHFRRYWTATCQGAKYYCEAERNRVNCNKL